MKLLLMDDHPLMLKGLAALLNRAGATVLAADSAQQALALAATSPGLQAVLMDWTMPGMDSAATLREFVALGLPVLVVSGSVESDDVRRALAAGALGYAPKSLSPEQLLAAVRQVLAGIPYVPAVMLRDIAALGGSVAPPMTGRQREVLQHLTAGLSNKAIGKQMDLSDKTVKAHVTAIFKSLGVVNRTQAIQRARALGLTD